jgi:hypothetical protein
MAVAIVLLASTRLSIKPAVNGSFHVLVPLQLIAIGLALAFEYFLLLLLSLSLFPCR